MSCASPPKGAKSWSLCKGIKGHLWLERNKLVTLLSVCGCKTFLLRLGGNKYSNCVSWIADNCLNFHLGKGCQLASFISYYFEGWTWFCQEWSILLALLVLLLIGIVEGFASQGFLGNFFWGCGGGGRVEPLWALLILVTILAKYHSNLTAFMQHKFIWHSSWRNLLLLLLQW